MKVKQSKTKEANRQKSLTVWQAEQIVLVLICILGSKKYERSEFIGQTDCTEQVIKIQEAILYSHLEKSKWA